MDHVDFTSLVFRVHKIRERGQSIMLALDLKTPLSATALLPGHVAGLQKRVAHPPSTFFFSWHSCSSPIFFFEVGRVVRRWEREKV